MRPFSEVLSAKPGVSLVKTAKYTEGSDTRNPYLAVLQGWTHTCGQQKGDFSLWIYTIIQVAEFCKQNPGYFFNFISTDKFYVL